MKNCLYHRESYDTTVKMCILPYDTTLVCSLDFANGEEKVECGLQRWYSPPGFVKSMHRNWLQIDREAIGWFL